MNDKIKDILSFAYKDLIDKAYKTDSIAKNKWRIENREQLREQRKKELKELMEKDKEMSKNKQSSLEYYIEKILDLDYEYAKGLITLGVWSERKNALIEQAKAMHKEEIIWAHGIKMKGVNNHKCVSGEQYYNETYGGNNEQL